jgi:hypothetical protein
MDDTDLTPISTSFPEPVGGNEMTVDLSTWLPAHPAVADSIRWQDASGVHPWPTWSGSWKSDLQTALDLACHGDSIPVAEIPENLATLADGDFPTTILAPSDAWAYFLASVAQSLAAEVGNQLLWRLDEYSADQLAELLDSRAMFNWNDIPAGYCIGNDIVHGWIVPAPPLFTYHFLVSNHLIDPRSRPDTIANLLNWCRSNLNHFNGGYTAANMQAVWQYRGLPPMPRVIEGTTDTSQPELGFHCFTAGCWGTTGFLRAALRAVNIPVQLVANAGHAQPWFMADGLYLSHGDDPYDLLTTAWPPIPASEIPIDQTKFNDWFGPNVSEADASNNIGRRLLELALIYLPIYLLNLYCSDIAGGYAHGAGGVFDLFSPVYTLAELEAQDLWTRMDAKLASTGGCG